MSTTAVTFDESYLDSIGPLEMPAKDGRAGLDRDHEPAARERDIPRKGAKVHKLRK